MFLNRLAENRTGDLIKPLYTIFTEQIGQIFKHFFSDSRALITLMLSKFRLPGSADVGDEISK
jgi:hypothetical protein